MADLYMVPSHYISGVQPGEEAICALLHVFPERQTILLAAGAVGHPLSGLPITTLKIPQKIFFCVYK